MISEAHPFHTIKWQMLRLFLYNGPWKNTLTFARVHPPHNDFWPGIWFQLLAWVCQRWMWWHSVVQFPFFNTFCPMAGLLRVKCSRHCIYACVPFTLTNDERADYFHITCLVNTWSQTESPGQYRTPCKDVCCATTGRILLCLWRTKRNSSRSGIDRSE
jgi:hypothetical protein